MMTRQKRIFLVFAVIFFLVLAIVAYDISRRTTFPGSKPQLQERLRQQYSDDTVKSPYDSSSVDR